MKKPKPAAPQPQVRSFHRQYMSQFMSFLSVWHYQMKKVEDKKSTPKLWTMTAQRPASQMALFQIDQNIRGVVMPLNKAGEVLAASFSDWLAADRQLYKVDRFATLVVFEASIKYKAAKKKDAYKVKISRKKPAKKKKG